MNTLLSIIYLPKLFENQYVGFKIEVRTWEFYMNLIRSNSLIKEN